MPRAAKRLLFQYGQLVTHAGRLLKLQVACMVKHDFFQPFDFAGDVLLGHGLGGLALLGFLRQFFGILPGFFAVHTVNQVFDALGDRARRDAVGQVEGHLLGAAALGFAHGALHRVGDAVGIQNGPARSGCAPRGQWSE
jgi:hypothetical protein